MTTPDKHPSPMDRAVDEFADDLDRVAADCTLGVFDVIVPIAVIAVASALLIFR